MLKFIKNFKLSNLKMAARYINHYTHHDGLRQLLRNTDLIKKEDEPK